MPAKVRRSRGRGCGCGMGNPARQLTTTTYTLDSRYRNTGFGLTHSGHTHSTLIHGTRQPIIGSCSARGTLPPGSLAPLCLWRSPARSSSWTTRPGPRSTPPHEQNTVLLIPRPVASGQPSARTRRARPCATVALAHRPTYRLSHTQRTHTLHTISVAHKTGSHPRLRPSTHR